MEPWEGKAVQAGDSPGALLKLFGENVSVGGRRLGNRCMKLLIVFIEIRFFHIFFVYISTKKK